MTVFSVRIIHLQELIQKTKEFCSCFANLFQVSMNCIMFEHKKLGAVGRCWEQKAGNSTLKAGEEKPVRKNVSGSMCIRESRKTWQKMYFSGYLAGVELVWDGISSDWFLPPPPPSPRFSDILYYNPINLAQGRKGNEKVRICNRITVVIIVVWK